MSITYSLFRVNNIFDVILYGSYARGDYQEWSDIDIMVLADADPLECKRLDNQITDELMDLIFQTNILLSVIVTPYQRFEHMKNHYPFYTNVLKDGIKLC